MPALMAAICLRENHWQVHHLAADLPIAELIKMVLATSADLVVLSTASVAGTANAERAARALRRDTRGVTVLIGHSGDSLSDLRDAAVRAREKSP